MLINTQKITESEMLRNWALAESSSVRRWKDIKSLLPSTTLAKLENKNFNLLNNEDYKNLEKMIKEFRAPLLDGLLHLKLDWYKGELLSKDIEKLKMINWPDFVDFVGSRNLIDLVNKFGRKEFPSHLPEFIENLKEVSQNLDLKQMVGLPIVVSKSIQGPCHLVEGFTRTSSILLNIKRGIFKEKAVSFIVGVGMSLDHWHYDNEQVKFNLY